MPDGNSITRSEVEAMINAALANVRGQNGAKGGEYKSGLKNQPSFQGPTGYGESQAEVSGMAMGAKVAREQANKRVEDARTAPNTPLPSAAPPPATVTPAQKHVEMGTGQRQIPDPIGGHRAADVNNGVGGATGSRGTESRGTGGRSKEAIADQIKETQEKFKAKAREDQKTIEDADAQMREATGQGSSPEVMGAIAKTAEGMAKTFVTEEQVKAMLSGIHPAILNQCRAGVQQNQGGVGDSYLKIPASVSVDTVAVWGKAAGSESGSGGVDYDLIVIGGKKYTPGTKTSNFLQIGANGSSSWVTGPIPNVMPTGYEIYDVTKNHIHITGATAGNI